VPVCAENIVATSHPLAAQAGLHMMRKGGNAVDAALAAAITLTVVEPVSNGIGSDAFALVWDGARLHGLNGSGRSPRKWTYEKFEALAEMPRRGWDTVTVPGAVDAWVQLSKQFGRLPFADLFAPAIHYARDGFPVPPIIAKRWSRAEILCDDFKEFAKTFMPRGRAPYPGELFKSPCHAVTLKSISDTRGESFYRGEMAKKITDTACMEGGSLTLKDMEEHASQWVQPLSLKYRGIDVNEIPPNGQGLATLIALGILRHWNIASYPVDSADSLHLQIEAMKIGFSEAHRHIADPASMLVSPERLLDDGFLARRAREIKMDRAGHPQSTFPVDGGTVYVTSADEEGVMVSYIQSNYLDFGSGIVIPGTGINLHCRGRGFVVKKDHPNGVSGGKRPYHTIIPGFMMKHGKPLMSFGVVGGHMQPQGHVQMVVRTGDYRQNPQTVCDAPRWYVSEDFRIALEPGFPDAVVKDLERRGQRFMEDGTAYLFGGGQLIYRMENGYCAASDPRKDGQAVGF
jgi:gamma-glutamyltranspeptidase/glutathione hydrolase